MGRFIVASLVVSFLVCAHGCNSGAGAKPTAESVKPALKKYLIAQHAGVNGAKVKKLTAIRVGDYQPQFKGWEVFSDYAVGYEMDGIPITNHGNSNGVATCLVRNVGGKVECFMPEFFKKLEKEMNDMVAGGF